jgi:multidrug resistance efflux pump
MAQWFRSDREFQLAQIKTERLELESAKQQQKRETLDREIQARNQLIQARNLELLRIKDQIAKAEATLHQGAVTAADAQITKAQLQNAATSLQSLVSGSIGVTPSTIAPGETARLQWNSFDATEVRISPDIGYVSPSGSAAVAPKVTTTYTLILGNSRSATSASATVQVIGVKPVRGSGHG